MFSKYIHKRINIVFIVVVLCFVLIIGKVLFIEVFSYNKLNDYANNLWSRNLPIMADRRRITTSDHIVVADSLTTVSLVFIPNQIAKEKKKKYNLLYTYIFLYSRCARVNSSCFLFVKI